MLSSSALTRLPPAGARNKQQIRRQRVLRPRASAAGSAGGQILREVLRPEERLKYDG